MCCVCCTRTAVLVVSAAGLGTAVALFDKKKKEKKWLQLGFEPRTSSTQMRNANHYTTEAHQDSSCKKLRFYSTMTNLVIHQFGYKGNVRGVISRWYEYVDIQKYHCINTISDTQTGGILKQRNKRTRPRAYRDPTLVFFSFGVREV